MLLTLLEGDVTQHLEDLGVALGQAKADQALSQGFLRDVAQT